MSRSKEDFSIKQGKNTIYWVMKPETWSKDFLIVTHKNGSLLKLPFHTSGSKHELIRYTLSTSNI